MISTGRRPAPVEISRPSFKEDHQKIMNVELIINIRFIERNSMKLLKNRTFQITAGVIIYLLLLNPSSYLSNNSRCNHIFTIAKSIFVKVSGIHA